MKVCTLKPFDDGKYLSEEDALKLLESIPILEKLEEKIEVRPASKDATKQSINKYILMPQTNTYALGLHALQEQCIKENNQNHPTFNKSDKSKIYRPLTFKENIQARVDNYETIHNPDGSERTLDERLSLMEKWNDSCTAIVYKKGATKFKIVPISEHLITLDFLFNSDFLRVDYNTIVGSELDSKNGTYNASMSKDSVLMHEGWLAAVEGDGALLKYYTNIIFTELKRNWDCPNGMAFWVGHDDHGDLLGALYINNINCYSNAARNGFINTGGSFLQAANR